MMHGDDDDDDGEWELVELCDDSAARRLSDNVSSDAVVVL